MPLFHFGFSAMASVNELQIWADAETDARCGADAAIADVQRIEAKYSRYRDDSVVTRINREAGRAEILIDPETAALLRYADQCYRLERDSVRHHVRRAAPRLGFSADASPASHWFRTGGRRIGNRLVRCRMERACHSSATPWHGNRLRRHRQGICRGPDGDPLPRARPGSCSRQPWRRCSSRWAAARWRSLAHRNPAPTAGRRSHRHGRARRLVRLQPAAITNVFSRSTAVGTVICSMRVPAGLSGTGNR